MQNYNYMLAISHENIDNKWSVLYRNFVLEETKNNIVEGLFLRDMWFNKEIYGDYKAKKMHFMLIGSNKHKKYISEDLNRPKNNMEVSSIYDKPYNTSDEAYYFELSVNEIEDLADFMTNNEKVNSKKVILNCKDRKYNAVLSLFVHFIDDKLYITLPSFKID